MSTVQNLSYLDYRKVANSSLSLVSSTFSDFQKAYEGEILCLCSVTFDQKYPNLNSGPVYCSRLYGILKSSHLLTQHFLFYENNVRQLLSIFSNLNYNCSIFWDLGNLQEQVKKAFCYQNTSFLTMQMFLNFCCRLTLNIRIYSWLFPIEWVFSALLSH